MINFEFVEAVKKYAFDHYEKGGWDYVIETMDDADIWAVVSKTRSCDGAINKMAALAHSLGQHRAEVQAEVF